ncbi:uncharacterized protein [Palaemon carinicauda]|uniref:uncharacterized protein isoform X2 n=1 Tax=Palaemon carinicauda TaxID=392227 RepID=UPI0035B5E3A9
MKQRIDLFFVRLEIQNITPTWLKSKNLCVCGRSYGNTNMDDDSSPRQTSSGSGRRRKLTKKTSSPRPRPLPLTSESSEDSNPGATGGASSDSSKDVPERRCQSQSPRKRSKHKGGRERSRERVRTGTRRRSATSEEKEGNSLRQSRSHLSGELKVLLTEGLPEPLQDTGLQWSVSESTGSSRLEHQQSTTSYGSSTMGNDDNLEEEEELDVQYVGDDMPCASGQQTVTDEEMHHSFGQLSVSQHVDMCAETQSRRFQASTSNEGMAVGREPTFEESLTAQLQAFSPPCIRHPNFSRSGEEGLSAQLHNLSPQSLRELQYRMSGEESRAAEGQHSKSPSASPPDDDYDDIQYMEIH